MKSPPYKKFVSLLFHALSSLCPQHVLGVKRSPAGSRLAIVVDERLSALRLTPELIR